MLNVGMSHFQSYTRSKADKFGLSIIDLLYVSNLKGGNASITEPEPALSKKLKRYDKKLRELHSLIAGKTLRNLSCRERDVLKARAIDFLGLTQRKEAEIRGFDPSYASALLSAYFPEVTPILDRRVLNGARIPVRWRSNGQVANIISHYGQLIDAFHRVLSKERELSLRQLDKRWFCASL